MKLAATFVFAFLLISVAELVAVTGSVDAFNPDVGVPYVLSAIVQPDGKIVIGGAFSSVGGTARNNVARLNADGSVDTTFNPGTGVNGAVHCLAVQVDGKILIGGRFTSINGQARNNIARLNADGGVDATFNPGTGANNAPGDPYVLSIVVQMDGKILLGGAFTSVNGQVRNHIVRLNADGSVESTATFDPGTGADSDVSSMAVQADGKILIGGSFDAVNGQLRNNLAALNSNGSVDTTFNPFNPNTGVIGSVLCLAVQADGKILLGGGDILQIAGASIARLNADGSLDTTFNPGTGATGGNIFVESLAVQADGKILLGGYFNAVNGQGRPHIARLNADGSVESTATFNPRHGASDIVESVSLQADGRILLGGWFTSVDDTARNRIARLVNDAANQTLSVPNSTEVQWQRGGAGPEVSQVTFELSINGGATWSALGNATRASGGWQLTGLSLPAHGFIRARGRTTGGKFNGSSGLLEQVAVFPPGPEIAVEQPLSADILDGGARGFGTAVVGSTTSLTFIIKNVGDQDLSGLTVTTDGASANEFTLAASPTAPVSGPSGSTTFTIRFAPTTGGAKTAAIHIASNDADESPFDISLTGLALSFTNDTDGDGMSDAAEFQMAVLGFDWQVSQPSLVDALYSNANGAGLFNQTQMDANRLLGRNDVINAPNTYNLYTLSQVQALNVGTPLLLKDQSTGQFKLTIGLEKSTDLIHYAPFPMTAPQSLINTQGNLEFLFTVPDDAAFFRLQTW